MVRMNVKKQQDGTAKIIQLQKSILLYSIASFLLPEYNKVINKFTDITQVKKQNREEKT